MMHNEFMNLSGVTVSQRYYQEVIEPQYMHGNIDKTEFCADWVKRNKSKLCKAVTVDIDKLSLDLCLMDCHKSDAARNKQELEVERNARTDAESKLAKRDLTIERLDSELEELRKSVAIKQDCYDGLMTDYNELLQFKHECTTKDVEIQKLKAMLFDLIAGVTA